MDWKVEGQIRLGYLLLQINLLADWTGNTHVDIHPLFELSLIAAAVFPSPFTTSIKGNTLNGTRGSKARLALGCGKSAQLQAGRRGWARCARILK